MKDVIYNDIDDRIPGRNNFLRPLKPNASVLQCKRAVLLLFRLFGNTTRVISNKDKNSSKLSSSNSLPKLLQSIMRHDSSNSLLNFNDSEL